MKLINFVLANPYIIIDQSISMKVDLASIKIEDNLFINKRFDSYLLRIL
jgi:hypothetical protein